MFVATTLRLNRNDELATVLVDADIDFVDLDLADVLNRRSQVILKGIGGKPRKMSIKRLLLARPFFIKRLHTHLLCL